MSEKHRLSEAKHESARLGKFTKPVVINNWWESKVFISLEYYFTPKKFTSLSLSHLLHQSQTPPLQPSTPSLVLLKDHNFCLLEEAADIMDFDFRASFHSVKHLSAVQAARLHSGTSFHLLFRFVLYFLFLFFPFFLSSWYSWTPLAIHLASWCEILRLFL